ncbi:MAG: succinyl-diaminopimelate desuccinylase [Gaiellaceae bacterium]
MPAPEETARRLAERTLELVDIPSVSHQEVMLAQRVAALMPAALELRHAHDYSLFYRAAAPGKPLVVLGGHLDTVPPQDNLPGRIEDGHVLGLGACDMKSGLAVMIELARWIADSRPELAFDVGFLFFPREELPTDYSALPGIFERAPELLAAELVIMLEPTANAIHAGCLGNLNANLVFHGESAHAARPWQGVNAIRRAVEGLQPLLAFEPREVLVQGLPFVEVLSVTRIEGGIAHNVIPDRCVAGLNFRYAPGTSPAEAEARLRALVGSSAQLELTGNSPSGSVAAGAPLVQRLREAGDLALEPKQAWTPVAEFSAKGLDAVNFGPGDPRYAHRADERVAAADLERCFSTFQRFLAS